MIHATKTGDLTFEIRFDEKLRRDLQDIAGWGSVANAIERLLSNVLLGCEYPPRHGADLDDEVPF